MKQMIALFGCLLLMAGCATTEGAKTGAPAAEKAGFLGEHVAKLAPGPEGGARMRWIKPGVDFAKYNQVMIDSVVFFLSEESEYKGVDPQELKALADGFNLQVVNAVKAKYPIVSEPGPNVLRVRFAVTELKQSRPLVSGVTSVLPVGIGISLVKKGATDSWTGSGATGAEMLALDSTTNEVILAAKDSRTAGFTERFSKWGSADEAFKYWGERIALFLDEARGLKK
jgi:hypothetical protein